MKDELVSFKVAKLAKESGFDIVCDQMYGNQNIPQLEPYNKTRYDLWRDYYFAPTQSLLQRWLREVRFIHIEIIAIRDVWMASINIPNKFKYYNSVNSQRINVHKKDTDWSKTDNYEFNTYEEALERALEVALQLK